MADTAVSIHPEFPRWYAEIDVTGDEARRAARSAAVAAAANAADSELIECLVRIAFRSRTAPSPASRKTFLDALQSADAAFPSNGNDRELQIMAASTLADLMHDGGEIGAEAALAAAVSSFGGARKIELPMDLDAMARQSLVTIANQLRKRPNATSLTIPPKLDSDAAVAGLKAEFNHQTVLKAIETAKANLATLVNHHVKNGNAVERFLRVQDEELQMLWWLVGDRSIDLDCAFSEVPLDAQPLVLAKELADMTQMLPGPASVIALLAKAGIKDKKKPVSAMINAVDTAWIARVLPPPEIVLSPLTAPLHLALRRQQETGKGTAWIAGWAAAAEVPTALTISPLAFGLQFYRERVLRAFADEADQ